MHNRTPPQFKKSMASTRKEAEYLSQFDEAFYTTHGYKNYLAEHESIAEKDIVEPLLKVLSPQPDWTFLDVGCGMGGALLILRERGFHAMGTEVSAHCLAHSPAKQWMVYGASYELPFPDRSFDTVFSCNVMQYLSLERAQQSVQEFIRVSRKFVSIWVFDPHSIGWSDVENPDPQRLEDTKKLSSDDWISLFKSHGAVPLHSHIDLSESGDVPDWHLVFSTAE